MARMETFSLLAALISLRSRQSCISGALFRPRAGVPMTMGRQTELLMPPDARRAAPACLRS